MKDNFLEREPVVIERRFFTAEYDKLVATTEPTKKWQGHALIHILADEVSAGWHLCKIENRTGLLFKNVFRAFEPDATCYFYLITNINSVIAQDFVHLMSNESKNKLATELGL